LKESSIPLWSQPRSRVCEEELAKIACVKVETVHRTAHELLELLERDLECHGVAVKGSKIREQGRGAREREKSLEDWEPLHDSIGVTHWLPPRRCLNSD
jgi:hypothetical protein